eukprot:12982767-Alexandrium_andersonii.AAC.1
MGRLRQCLLWVLSRGRVSGQQLEAIVGHLVLAFVIRRPLLSLMCSVHRFIRRNGVSAVAVCRRKTRFCLCSPAVSLCSA